MRFSLSIFLLLMLSLSSFGQKNISNLKVSRKIKKIVYRMKKNNKLETPQIGRFNAKSKQYMLFELLKKKAKPQELITLTNHSNAVVRCYAFQAIIDIPEIDVLPLVINHINDTSEAEFLYYGIFGSEIVGDFYYGHARRAYLDSTSIRFDVSNATKLDSIILHTPNNLKHTKSTILYNIKPLPQNYKKIRELAVEGNIHNSIIALAKYQNKDDISIILDTTKNEPCYIFSAIYFFSDSVFYPFLMNYFNKLDKNSIKYMHRIQSYYRTLILYQNQQTLNILIKSFEIENDKLRDTHLTALLPTSGENLPSFYNSIYWKLWEEEKRITISIFKHLNKIDSLRTLKNSKYSLTHLDERIDSWAGEYFDDELIFEMLDIVYKNDKPFYIDITLKNIENIDPHIIFPFIEVIKVKKDKIFVEPMLNYLSNTKHMYQCKTFVEALMLYDNEEITSKMLQSMNKNPFFSIPDNKKEINAFLKKYNIKK